MTRFALLVLSLCLLTSWLGAQALPGSAAAPEDFRFVTTDIDHFWEAYDLAYPWFFPQLFDSLYLRRGTAGLKPVAALFTGGKDAFCSRIRQEWDYYELIRPAMTALRKEEREVRAAAFALKYLFPEARFPDIHFIVGAPASGSAAIGGRLLIDAGLFGPAGPTHSRARRRLRAPYALENAVTYIAWVLVRYQQPPLPGQRRPWEQHFRQGAAEFVAELITGRRLHAELDTLPGAHTKDLFRATVRNTPLQPVSTGYIATEQQRTGWWAGYQVARSYYERAKDKRAAIQKILQLRNCRELLEESRWMEASTPSLGMEIRREAATPSFSYTPHIDTCAIY